MPDAPPACLRCQTPMAEGFLLEFGSYDVQRVTQWVAGAPERGVLSGVNGLGVDHPRMLPVVTYRCPACGYLESYTRPRTGADPNFG